MSIVSVETRTANLQGELLQVVGERCSFGVRCGVGHGEALRMREFGRTLQRKESSLFGGNYSMDDLMLEVLNSGRGRGRGWRLMAGAARK